VASFQTEQHLNPKHPSLPPTGTKDVIYVAQFVVLLTTSLQFVVTGAYFSNKCKSCDGILWKNELKPGNKGL
jgi:hypothetical protein